MAIVTAQIKQPPAVDGNAIAQIGDRLNRYWRITGDWVAANATELFIAALAGCVLYALLSWIRRRAAKTATDRGDDSTIAGIALRAISRTSRFFRIMLCVELVNGYSNMPAPIAKTILFLFTVAIVIQVAIWLREIILSIVERRASQSGGESDTLANAMSLIRMGVSFILFAIAAVVILSNLGVNVTGLVAGLGVGGIAIGLAAQGIFSDLFAALAIIFDQPFKRGDIISYDMTTARVDRIGMKSTRLRALTGEEKIISNSKLLEKELTNASAAEHKRCTFTLAIVQHTPVATIRRIPEILQDIIVTEELVFIRAGFTSFMPSSFDFQLIFDVNGNNFGQFFDARHRVGIAIIEAFAREGISFAYPAQTSFTAAPDGSFIMPYASEAKASQKTQRKA
jgi:small-conductance mechanosensitive channel